MVNYICKLTDKDEIKMLLDDIKSDFTEKSWKITAIQAVI